MRSCVTLPVMCGACGFYGYDIIVRVEARAPHDGNTFHTHTEASEADGEAGKTQKKTQ